MRPASFLPSFPTDSGPSIESIVDTVVVGDDDCEETRLLDVVPAIESV